MLMHHPQRAASCEDWKSALIPDDFTQGESAATQWVNKTAHVSSLSDNTLGMSRYQEKADSLIRYIGADIKK